MCILEFAGKHFSDENIGMFFSPWLDGDYFGYMFFQCVERHLNKYWTYNEKQLFPNSVK